LLVWETHSCTVLTDFQRGVHTYGLGWVGAVLLCVERDSSFHVIACGFQCPLCEWRMQMKFICLTPCT